MDRWKILCASALTISVSADDLDDANQLIANKGDIAAIQNLLGAEANLITLATQANRAAQILTAGNEMLEIAIENHIASKNTTSLCSAMDFVADMAHEMTTPMIETMEDGRVTSLPGKYITAMGTKVFRDGNTIATPAATNVEGLSVELNCNAPFSVVSWQSAEYAQLCLEERFSAVDAQKESGKGAFSASLLSDIKIIGAPPTNCTALQITMPQSDIHLSLYCRETRYVSNFWPRSLGAISFDECISLGHRGFIFNETLLRYSEDGTYDVSWQMTGETPTVTFSTSSLQGIFGVSEKIKHADKRNKASHVLFGLIAFACFLALAVYIFHQNFKHLWAKHNDDGMSDGNDVKQGRMPLVIKKFMLVILIGHTLNEFFLLIYYMLPSDDESGMNDLIRFFLILPVSFHIWACSIAIYAWMMSYWSCTGQRSRNQISEIRSKLVKFNIFQSVCIGFAAIFYVAQYNRDQRTATLFYRGTRILFALGIFGVAITFLVAGLEMMKHVVFSAKQAQRGWNSSVVKKLRILELLISWGLGMFSVTTMVSVWAPSFWEVWDSQLEMAVKMSDIACYFIIVYLFRMTTDEERQARAVKERKLRERMLKRKENERRNHPGVPKSSSHSLLLGDNYLAIEKEDKASGSEVDTNGDDESDPEAYLMPARSSMMKYSIHKMQKAKRLTESPTGPVPVNASVIPHDLVQNQEITEEPEDNQAENQVIEEEAVNEEVVPNDPLPGQEVEIPEKQSKEQSPINKSDEAVKALEPDEPGVDVPVPPEVAEKEQAEIPEDVEKGLDMDMGLGQEVEPEPAESSQTAVVEEVEPGMDAVPALDEPGPAPEDRMSLRDKVKEALREIADPGVRSRDVMESPVSISVMKDIEEELKVPEEIEEIAADVQESNSVEKQSQIEKSTSPADPLSSKESRLKSEEDLEKLELFTNPVFKKQRTRHIE